MYTKYKAEGKMLGLLPQKWAELGRSLRTALGPVFIF